MTNKVGIVYSNELSSLLSTSPKYGNRYQLVMDLIHAYKMTHNLIRIPPIEWTNDEEMLQLTTFHSRDFLDALRQLDSFYAEDIEPNLSDDVMEFLENYGLAYDCYGFQGVYEYALAGVRSTFAAFEALLHGQCQIAINWAGGWHHGKRAEASGFCYLNDIVVGIHHILSSSEFAENPSYRVLYLDFDLHHGDGVEEAFAYNARVITFSVHHASPGFFPGTGDCLPVSTLTSTESVFFTGARGGRFSCFNLPLAEGADDKTWIDAVSPILSALHKSIDPRFVVVQCGADVLTSDPHRTFNLSVGPDSAFVNALNQILSWKVATLVLGGGGYHFPDTARLWTLLTSVVISHSCNTPVQLSEDIPDHSKLVSFGPDYTLYVSKSMRPNKNSPQSVNLHVLRLLNQLASFCDLNKLTFSS